VIGCLSIAFDSHVRSRSLAAAMPVPVTVTLGWTAA
jgi:hypothetical protein